ncbi:hypothetical protein G6F22_004045 [Rhizopus arrhizus]|nr:hypothetical protein G6F22_004045 [Rhizopus arrhizus]
MAEAKESNSNSVTIETNAEPPQVTRQKYEEAKQELQALLNRKKQVDTNLINLEHAIYLFEGSYLEDTQQNGNIIRGFDGYLSTRSDRRKPKFTELDRLFSLSSSTYQKVRILFMFLQSTYFVVGFSTKGRKRSRLESG